QQGAAPPATSAVQMETAQTALTARIDPPGRHLAVRTRPRKRPEPDKTPRPAIPDRSFPHAISARRNLAEQWRKVLDFKPGDSGGEPTALATDSACNLYVCGFMQNSRTDEDFITLKFDAKGRLVWERRYNGPGNDLDRARSIAVDAHGNVYVTGESDGGKGNGVGRHNCWDYATVKYDAAGDLKWVARYNGAGNGVDQPVKVALDGVEDVYVTGTSYGGRATGNDIVTIKYDMQTGRQVWAQRYNGPASLDDEAADMQVTPAGDVYVTGTSVTSIRAAGKGDNLSELTALKYDTNGRLVWAKHWAEGNDCAKSRALCLDEHENLLIAASLGCGSAQLPWWNEHGLLVRMDRDGKELWSKCLTMTQTGYQMLLSATVDPYGDSCVLSDGATTPSENYPAARAVGLCRYSPQGKRLWYSDTFGARLDHVVATGMGVGPTGAVYASCAGPGSDGPGHPDELLAMKYSQFTGLTVRRIHLPLSDCEESRRLLTIDVRGNVYIACATYVQHEPGYLTIVKFTQ
ncbi:MAG TPA: SBBP repeat-containing protein, partial [Chthonomonadales bacterium]|nr:SBBP repeat-containing protein [Chthonomonadales bacterium]